MRRRVRRSSRVRGRKRMRIPRFAGRVGYRL